MTKEGRTKSTKIPKDLRVEEFVNDMGISLKEYEEVFFKPCKNKEELSGWIELYFGLKVPSQTVSRYSTTNMLDFLWFVYESFMYKNGGLSLLLVTNRGGGKTLTSAILEILHLFHGCSGAIHVGASRKIAKRAYEYVQSFAQRNSAILDPLQKRDTMEKSEFILKDKTSVSIEVLTCTLKDLNGPHQPFICMDELDVLDKAGMLAYSQISGIPVKNPKTGAHPIELGISTRKSRAGIVHKQMENAALDNRIVHIWNRIDLMEKCPDSRSGTSCITAWNNQKIMRLMSETDFLRLNENQKNEYSQVQVFENCIRCPLGSVCLGDSKKQNSSSSLSCSYDEVLKKFRKGTDYFLAEEMCLLPSLEGIVFNRFDTQKHVLTPRQMIERITGSDFGREATQEELLSEIRRMNLEIYGGIDWGWASPSVLVVVCVDTDREIAYVLGTFFTPPYTNHQDFINLIKNNYQPYFHIQLYFPDVADGSAIDLLIKAGLPTYKKINKNIGLGVQIIKSLLIEAGTEIPKIFFLKDKNLFLENEIQSYRYETDTAGNVMEGKFRDENNHSIDSLRYVLTHFFSKGKSNLDFVLKDDIAYMQYPAGHFPLDCINGIKGTWRGNSFLPEKDQTSEINNLSF